MRPERSRDTGRAARVARARLFVKADLAWVGGHPTGGAVEARVPWSVPATTGRPARAVVVNRESLHRATRTLRELELRFGDVLDDVLDDARAWMAGARVAIDLLKPFVHGSSRALQADGPLASGVFRSDVVAAVRAAPDALQSVLRAMAWITLVSPQKLGRAVTFALAHRDAFETLQRALPQQVEAAALQLVLLAEQEGARRVAPFARLLAIRGLYEVPTLGVEYAHAIAKAPRGARPAKHAVTLGPALAAFTSEMLEAPSPARRGALAVLAVLDLGPAVVAWADWWARIASCERLARKQPESEGDAQARAEATRLSESVPRALRPELALSLLRGALGWDDTTRREALRALAELPAFEHGTSARLFLAHWSRLAGDGRPGNLGRLLRAFASYLVETRSCGARRLQPWASVLDRERGRVSCAPPDAALLGGVPEARWPVFYEALARIVETGEGDLAQLTPALVAVVPLGGDAAHVQELARAYGAVSRHTRPGPELRIAFDLAGGEPGLFARCAAAFGESDAETERGYLMRALDLVRRRGGDELARALLLEEPQALVAFGRRLALLRLVDRTPELDSVRFAPRDVSWTSSYPAWLLPSLRRLAESDAQAERTARRLLGDDVRSAAAVRRELEHLESLVQAGTASDRMRRRGVNLRVRLASPPAVAPELRARLVAKVERAGRRARLARLEGGLDARIRAGLLAQLEQEAPPSWLSTPRTLEQLAPIASFEPAMRTLAIRVLRVRAGPPPWDLREDPANHAYLARLQRAGVDVAPWVDGVGSVSVTVPSGDTLTLRLEDDPLEILDMGKHFATCLSPGAVNYFSTFGNVADANKRVLFARDTSGKVVGRCLLALTAAGALVAFHPYAHDTAIGFPAIVASFAADLAARMGILVAPHGEIPRLVAPDWYDDGPVDLGGRFPFLQDNAPFRQSVATLTPARFVEEARRLFAPLPLGALTLPLLVAMPEIDTRPELLEPLLPALAAAEGLPLPTVARALALLGRTSEAGAASRALVPRLVAGLRRVDEDEHGWLDGAWRTIVAASPGDALRLLRETRARGVRSWADERDPRRLEMAARATEELRRPRAAAAIYRLTAENAWNAASRKSFQARADALEAALGPGTSAAPRRR